MPRSERTFFSERLTAGVLSNASMCLVWLCCKDNRKHPPRTIRNIHHCGFHQLFVERLSVTPDYTSLNGIFGLLKQTILCMTYDNIFSYVHTFTNIKIGLPQDSGPIHAQTQWFPKCRYLSTPVFHTIGLHEMLCCHLHNLYRRMNPGRIWLLNCMTQMSVEWQWGRRVNQRVTGWSHGFGNRLVVCRPMMIICTNVRKVLHGQSVC